MRKLMRFVAHTRGRCRLALAAMLFLLGGSLESARAATGLPPGFQDVPVVSGLSNPTAMEFAPDGRLFVAQQSGQLRVIKNGVLLSTPFLTLTVSPGSERGLLGIAFDPNFASNQYVYVFYTATTPAHNRISRFTALGDVKHPAVPEVILLDFDNLGTATNHNGGAIHFGPDGKLYAAHGENATSSNAQTLTNLLGKIIRMNPVPASDPNQIPMDNPFVGTAGVSGKNQLIWALGLRNPFTFSFQPGTGRAFVNDVGAGTWEEINDASAGDNFGWPTTEGPFTPSSFPAFTNPVYSYQHDVGTPTGCAITGGAFYNPLTPTFPASYIGKYFFADLCSGWIYSINPSSPATATQFAASISGPVDLKVGPDGALYYLAINSGSVGKIVMPAGPQITQQPAPRTVPVGGIAMFMVSATGTLPLAYQWQKNGMNIPGATSASFLTPPVTMADHNSTYTCRVTNPAGTATSNPARLTVSRDFDGDGQTDIAVFRPSNGTWYVRGTSVNSANTWGGGGDIPVARDYDGDGRTDIAVFRPTTGAWYIWQSGSLTPLTYTWGGGADIAVPADYDGDGRTDIAVFRPATGGWYIWQSSTQTSLAYTWGGGGDIPVPRDYDGDGEVDIAVFRPATGGWYIWQSSTQTGLTYTWGGGADIPVPADYDGDGKTDIAVFRSATGAWYIWRSGTQTSLSYTWGGGADVPVPDDYDGDGKTDIAVFRPATGAWYIWQSSTQTGRADIWGGEGDIPALKRP